MNEKDIRVRVVQHELLTNGYEVPAEVVIKALERMAAIPSANYPNFESESKK